MQRVTGGRLLNLLDEKLAGDLHYMPHARALLVRRAEELALYAQGLHIELNNELAIGIAAAKRRIAACGIVVADGGCFDRLTIVHDRQVRDHAGQREVNVVSDLTRPLENRMPV